MTDLSAAGLSRRALLIGGALGIGAGTAYAMTPRKTEKRLGTAKLGDLIPRQFGAWDTVKRGDVVVASEDEATPVEGYDQVLTRTYAAAGLPEVMLLIAYGSTQGGSLQLHRPETCYPGQGFTLNDFSISQGNFDSSRPVAMRHFTARRDERIERVIYWTRVADRFPLNTAELYAVILSSVLKGVVPDGILVRFSTIGAVTPQTDATLQRFGSSMIDAMAAPTRKILIA